jgi:micrococcal nuclease
MTFRFFYNHLCLTLLINFLLLSTVTLKGQTYNGYILSVIDGDTYVFQTETGSLKIRAEGIDAPEYDQHFGDSATAYLKQFIYLDAVVMANGTDRYGRTIGTLYVNGVDINQKLLSSGLAWFYAAYSTNENYRLAEQAARQSMKGLWIQNDPLAPWDWRKRPIKDSLDELDHTQVLICTSKNSYSYHKSYCLGLRRCKSEIKIISIKEAKAASRAPCEFCY